MQCRVLGRTGLKVSCIGLGTVELGLDYGIQVPGEFGRPLEDEALRILNFAAESGVNVFDTARAYGNSEEILGKALGKRLDCIIATKVNIPSSDGQILAGAELQRHVTQSLDASLLALQRDVLDIVQIHNATPEVLEHSELLDVLDRARLAGKVRFLGASVYGEDAALSAIHTGRVDVLQIAFNLLDQRMARRVLPEAEKAGVGILSRSALLKGVLTAKSQWLPEDLGSLRDAADSARRMLGQTWISLPSAALRFCLSVTGIQSVIVGVRTMTELEAALDVQAAGTMDSASLAKAQTLGMEDELLLDPSHWRLP